MYNLLRDTLLTPRPQLLALACLDLVRQLWLLRALARLRPLYSQQQLPQCNRARAGTRTNSRTR